MSDNAWPYPLIVAHRGGGKLAPENTLAAIDIGAKFGHRMIEFDVKLAKDGEIFLLHDDTLDRTSNGQGIAGELNWPSLAQLDAGGWFGEAFRHERLPLLSQVASRCARWQMMANIEIKPTTGLETVTGHAVALAAHALWQGQTPPLLSSFSVTALAAAQAAVPGLPRGLLMHQWLANWPQQVAGLACVSVHVNHRILTAARVAQLKDTGLRVMAYTVNRPARVRTLISWGVDAICTDRIDIIDPAFH